MRVGANDSNTQLLLDSVQLYKALGGGWQVFEPAAKPAAHRHRRVRRNFHETPSANHEELP